MCSPTAALAVSAVASVASTGLAVYSGIQQGKQAEDVAAYNARVSENEAQTARNVANEAENDHREKVAKMVSTQRAQLGASGVRLDSGTPLQLLEDTELSGEADALRIRSMGDRRVAALNESAYLTTVQGKNAKTQGYVNSFGSLLSGTGKTAGVVSKWYQSKV